MVVRCSNLHVTVRFCNLFSLFSRHIVYDNTVHTYLLQYARSLCRSSNMVEVKAGHNEQRGLIQLRNQLVAYLGQRVSLQQEEGEGEDRVTEFLLPEPINFETACARCDYLGKE